MGKIAIVTGGNQGLGLALVRGLCRALGPGAIVILAARDEARGRAAIGLLEGEGLHPELARLDVTDEEAVQALAGMVRSRHGGVDVVISNAAARIDKVRPPALQVGPFIDTNNHGLHRMIRHFAPLLRDGGRFLVVASSFGSLRNFPPRLHDRFDVERRSLEEIEQVLDEYAASVRAGRDRDEGWPGWINIPSKVGQVASAKILARELRDDPRRVLVDAVCPGLVDTEASRPWFDDMSAAQTPDQAAVDVVWLATSPSPAALPRGELVQHRRVIPWR
jgi:carbonyl reductase 1